MSNPQRSEASDVCVVPSFPETTETTLHKFTISHIWIVNDISLYFENSEGTKSAIFSSKDDTVDKNKWCLELIPNIDLIDHGNEYDIPVTTGLSLYLHLVSSNEISVLVKYKMLILNDEGEFIERVSGFERVTSGHKVIKGEYFLPNKYFGYRMEEFLPGDKLTLSCEVTTFMASTRGFVGESAHEGISEGSIIRDFSLLLENEEFSDLTIVGSGGREFRAHKAILGARSPVFAAMFKNEMIENKQNRVEIVDIEHDVLWEMLRFIYTGTTRNVGKIAAELLAAADKYELKGLQNICETVLSESMTCETAAQLLVLADMHQLKNLKSTAIDFIKNHFQQVKKTEGCVLMAKIHPQLTMESLLFKPGSDC